MPETINSVENVPSEQSQPESTRRQPLLSVLRSRNILLALTILLLSALRPATLAILIQYVTLRFEWKYSQAAVLVAEVAIVNIILFLVIPPQVVSRVSAARQIRTEARDWAVVNLSLILLSLGDFFIGWSPSPRALFAGKSALDPALYSSPSKNSELVSYHRIRIKLWHTGCYAVSSNRLDKRGYASPRFWCHSNSGKHRQALRWTAFIESPWCFTWSARVLVGITIFCCFSESSDGPIRGLAHFD